MAPWVRGPTRTHADAAWLMRACQATTGCLARAAHTRCACGCLLLMLLVVLPTCLLQQPLTAPSLSNRQGLLDQPKPQTQTRSTAAYLKWPTPAPVGCCWFPTHSTIPLGVSLSTHSTGCTALAPGMCHCGATSHNAAVCSTSQHSTSHHTAHPTAGVQNLWQRTHGTGDAAHHRRHSTGHACTYRNARQTGRRRTCTTMAVQGMLADADETHSTGCAAAHTSTRTRPMRGTWNPCCCRRAPASKPPTQQYGRQSGPANPPGRHIPQGSCCCYRGRPPAQPHTTSCRGLVRRSHAACLDITHTGTVCTG